MDVLLLSRLTRDIGELRFGAIDKKPSKVMERFSVDLDSDFSIPPGTTNVDLLY